MVMVRNQPLFKTCWCAARCRARCLFSPRHAFVVRAHARAHRHMHIHEHAALTHAHQHVHPGMCVHTHPHMLGVRPETNKADRRRC